MRNRLKMCWIRLLHRAATLFSPTKKYFRTAGPLVSLLPRKPEGGARSVLASQPLTYELLNSTIVKPREGYLYSWMVKGVVLNEAEQPISGVSVTVKGKNGVRQPMLQAAFPSKYHLLPIASCLLCRVYYTNHSSGKTAESDHPAATGP